MQDEEGEVELLSPAQCTRASMVEFWDPVDCDSVSSSKDAKYIQRKSWND